MEAKADLINNKVSIIIPVYNARNYIIQTLESVFKQTYEDIEVILVDDCSTDGTFEIEKKIEKEHDEVLLIKNDVNSGQTLSRNHGLKHISGNWFMFLDADDELEKNAVQNLVSAAEKYDADIVMCDYYNIYQDGHKVLNTAQISQGGYNCHEIADNLFKNIPLNVLSCVGTKLYKTEFLSQKKKTPDFPRTGGDFMFIMDALLSNPKIYYCKQPLYNYYVRSGSISNAYRENMYDDLIKTRERLWDLYRLTGLYENKKYELSILRYEIIYSSLYQETLKQRTYGNFLKEYKRILSDRNSALAISYIEKNDKLFKRRMLMKLFHTPRLLYYFMKYRK